MTLGVVRERLGFSWDEWSALPWWQARAYLEYLADTADQAQHGGQGPHAGPPPMTIPAPPDEPASPSWESGPLSSDMGSAPGSVTVYDPDDD